MAIRVVQTVSLRRDSGHSQLSAFLRSIDYMLLAAVGAVITYGMWVLATVSRGDVPGDPNFYVVRQGIAVGVGTVALALAMAVSPDLYRRWRNPLYVGAVALIAVVFVVGSEVRGSRRWLEIGSIQFQPAEVAKILLILFLAGFLAERAETIGKSRTVFAAVALATVPILLVFKQPDVGTALVLIAGVAAALFFAGTRWLHLGALAVLAVAVGLAMLWFLPSSGVQVLEPYQADRLTGFVNPDLDPRGTTYNITQSITAVGAGGLDGRSEATQTSLTYLPEHSTDFIFSSLAEQRGFLGASILLLLYALIVWRGVKIISIAPSLYAATVAGAIVFALLFQIFINVGMTIGIAPITGIPLPFVSAGGSSMVATMIMIGLLEAIHIRGRLAGRR